METFVSDRVGRTFIVKLVQGEDLLDIRFRAGIHDRHGEAFFRIVTVFPAAYQHVSGKRGSKTPSSSAGSPPLIARGCT